MAVRDKTSLKNFHIEINKFINPFNYVNQNTLSTMLQWKSGRLSISLTEMC